MPHSFFRFFFALFMLIAPTAQSAFYDITSGQLEINALKVGSSDDTYFQVVLQHQDNMIFTVQQVHANPDASTFDGTYDLNKGRVRLTKVEVADQHIWVELFRLDNGTFMGTLLNTFYHASKTKNYNAEAVIPAMCYTNTEGQYNPCYTCHQDAINGVNHENRMDDGELQGDYNFSDLGIENRWENLFIDRSVQIAAMPDEEILAYIHQENYSSLNNLPNDFEGWIPDIKNLHDPALAFDADGFAKDGSHWVAFNYKPLPSTFWPTNGSTDDVMIRLDAQFRNDAQGNYSKTIYQANLAIMEAAIKDLSRISVPDLDENEIGVDLNGDGQLSVISELQRPSHYVGSAAGIEVTSFLYPKGVEFLHTVRYVGVDNDGNIYNAPRMKEVRYMRKYRFLPKPILGAYYAEEQFEKYQGHYPYYNAQGKNTEKGMDNVYGWRIQGFIENQDGNLRAQNYEETFFCMGCHSTIGGTIDKTFSFMRKVEGAAGWGYINLKGMPDVPANGETEGEYLRYLRIVGGGDEFRQNEEMLERWFNADGSLNETAIEAALAESGVYGLLAPSRDRALALNKAYKLIVEEQSYIRGRDPALKPAVNVLRSVDVEVPPLDADKRTTRDMRLDWSTLSQ